MSRILPSLALAILLVLAIVIAAIAQTGTLAGLVQPFVVNIEQELPVEVTLALPMDDGTVITATTPITVGVSLQVKIDGAQVVVVTSGEAEDAVVSVDEPAPADQNAGVDAEGRSYTLEPDAGIEIAGVNSSINSLGGIELVGEITNVSEEDMELVEIIGTFYGAGGEVVLVENTYASLDTIQPGVSSPFKIMTLGETAEITSYKLQVRP